MEPYAEDWGWEIPLENERFKMFIGCSNQLDPGGNRFLCFIDPSKPEIQKGLLTKIDTTEDIGRVAEALDTILHSHSDIEGIRWWDDDEK